MVTDEATGLPLEGACVSVDGGERFVNTAADGTYRYGGLATGDHTVKFSDCHNDVYAAEWYERTSPRPRSRHRSASRSGASEQGSTRRWRSARWSREG